MMRLQRNAAAQGKNPKRKPDYGPNQWQEIKWTQRSQPGSFSIVNSTPQGAALPNGNESMLTAISEWLRVLTWAAQKFLDKDAYIVGL